MEKVIEEIRRIASEALIFLTKIVLAVLVVGIDLAIKNLAALVLNPDGYSYRVLAYVLDVVFVGTAIVISVTGAIVISAEFIVSTYRHLKRLKNETA